MPSPDTKTGVVLLAAGQGIRFGGGKLTAEFRGRPLWEWAAETAEAVDVSERLLVVGCNSPLARPGWRRIENPAAEQGMGTSIAAGVSALGHCARAIIVLADMPLVSSAHLGRLLASRGAAFTRYRDGEGGCPAIFPRRFFPQLLSLSGDRGARSLDLTDMELLAPGHEFELADVDEARDLEQLNSSLRTE